MSLYASLASAAALVMGAFIWVGSIASQVTQNEADVKSLHETVGTLTSDQREAQLTMAKLERDERETETQFCASDIIRNLMHATDLRNTSLLWQKVMGQPYPTDNAYYPTICNRSITAQ